MTPSAVRDVGLPYGMAWTALTTWRSEALPGKPARVANRANSDPFTCPRLTGFVCEAEAGAPVRAGSTIFRPQGFAAPCLAHADSSRRASQGLAGDPFA